MLSPVATEQTPAAVAGVPWTQRAPSQPGSSLFRPLHEEASPSDRLQWLAAQVAHEVSHVSSLSLLTFLPETALWPAPFTTMCPVWIACAHFVNAGLESTVAALTVHVSM